MYLSNIELLGFKSFPLKTKIEFADGMTGVVGPNGCGKTNVLDAIRWVLGEQRVSILRGGKMEDIIFSGTREMKPLGMAEVQLTVINNRNVLPTEYSSITITRRLHRSGESEYLLNNVPCRLKDITELFADTGMGANAYSAIELEMVEAILSDKADQRRVLFEEAAGITKYKLRKRAALRKLEATENDLLRLSDILSEVTTQVNSLRRQMRKAERFKALDEQIRNNTLVLLKDSCRKITADLRQVQEEKRVSEIKLAQVAGEIDKWELMREDARSRVTELTAQLNEVRSQMEAASARYHQFNNDVSVTSEKIKSAEMNNESDLEEIESSQRKREQLQEEQSGSAARLSELKEELERCEQEAEQAEQMLAEKLAMLEEARRTSQDSQRDLFEIEGRKSISEMSDRQLAEQIEISQAELGALNDKIEAARGALSEAGEIVGKDAETLQSAQASKNSLEEKLTALENELADIRAKLDEANAAFAEARMEVKSVETHVGLQEEMIAHYEGYGSGVGALFAEETALPGLIDTVANLIKPNEQFLRPLEQALAKKAEYVLVENREAAERGIQYLRENDLGRATFLIKDKVPSQSSIPVDEAIKNVDGFLCKASEQVLVAEQHREVVDLLLGNVLLARDYTAAREIQEAASQPCSIVTLDGHLLESNNTLQGGGESSAQLLGRDVELAQLKEKLGAAMGAATSAEELVQSLQQKRADLTAARADLVREIDATAVSYSEAQLSAARHELELKQGREQLRHLEEQLAGQRARVDELLNRRETLRQDSSRLAGDTDGKRAEFESQQERVDEIEREANQATRVHEQLKLRSIKLRAEVDSLTSAISRTSELIAELEAARENKQQARALRHDEILRLKKHRGDLQVDLESVSLKKEELKSSEMELTTQQGGLAEKQSDFEDLLKRARKERDIEADKHEQLLVAETEGKARYEDISRQLRDSYQINVSELALPEPLSPETVTELQTELTEAREKQEQIGMVNMLALEEYDRESQREEFLRKQIEDLTTAKDNLKTTITRINGTARKMFMETFDQVKVNFRQVFAELFQGGEADLRLEDDSDPLESPILISARPRGKRLLNISQLSGGEKALTAISLLFGIYLVKPSPFCILDEVDAPLDDANVGRFLKIVKVFSERTQFIIITHNKRTMEQCGRLYGVTMQAPGVSQIVSVDFEKIGREMTPETMTYEKPEADIVAPEPPESPPPPLEELSRSSSPGDEVEEQVGIAVDSETADEE